MTIKRQFKDEIPRRSAFLRSLPLREFFVDRGSVKRAQGALKSALKHGAERDIQYVLEAHPRLLVQNLSSGYGWVIPQKRLGSEYVTDFLLAERLSPGFYWQAVELESPKALMFTKSGDPSQRLVHAIRQIQDWRSWLEANQNYASRPRSESGLGLLEISPRLPGLILIGRRHETNPKTNALRRQFMADLRIEIRSIDSLLEEEKRSALYARFQDWGWG